MHHLKITDPQNQVNLENWQLSGKEVIASEKYISQLVNIFADEAARLNMDQQTLVYHVQAHLPVNEGTPGGLFFGTTVIQAGKVGDEYFMTRGHFHKNADRGEYYWGVGGKGMLILMDEQRNVWAEKVFPGSLHYIGSHIAHRVANVGNGPLIFGACWPSDAGHNYSEIDEKGFSARLLEVNGEPVLIENK